MFLSYIPFPIFFLSITFALTVCTFYNLQRILHKNKQSTEVAAIDVMFLCSLESFLAILQCFDRMFVIPFVSRSTSDDGILEMLQFPFLKNIIIESLLTNANQKD